MRRLSRAAAALLAAAALAATGMAAARQLHDGRRYRGDRFTVAVPAGWHAAPAAGGRLVELRGPAGLVRIAWQPRWGGDFAALVDLARVVDGLQPGTRRLADGPARPPGALAGHRLVLLLPRGTRDRPGVPVRVAELRALGRDGTLWTVIAQAPDRGADAVRLDAVVASFRVR